MPPFSSESSFLSLRHYANPNGLHSQASAAAAASRLVVICAHHHQNYARPNYTRPSCTYGLYISVHVSGRALFKRTKTIKMWEASPPPPIFSCPIDVLDGRTRPVGVVGSETRSWASAERQQLSSVRDGRDDLLVCLWKRCCFKYTPDTLSLEWFSLVRIMEDNSFSVGFAVAELCCCWGYMSLRQIGI